MAAETVAVAAAAGVLALAATMALTGGPLHPATPAPVRHQTVQVTDQ